MILAAGLGKRMRPLTDTLPKPLLSVRGKPLIVWHLERLAAAGVTEVLINLAYRGDQIKAALGDGKGFGLTITYSHEPQPLETGGAIFFVAEWLGEAPFLLINADVFTHLDIVPLLRNSLAPEVLGHLVLVPNPDFKPLGDFYLSDGVLMPLESAPHGSSMGGGTVGFTFAGVSVLRPELVMAYPDCREQFPLVEAFRWAMAGGRLHGEVYSGLWSDVGTPERLAALNEVGEADTNERPKVS